MGQTSRTRLANISTGMALAATLGATSAPTLAAPGDVLFNQEFFELKVCGNFGSSLTGALSGNVEADVEGFGSLGIDFYGNALKLKVTPKAKIGGSQSLGAGAGLSMTGCFDLIKLAEVVAKQDVTTEAEEALIDALSAFDPEELKNTLVNVAYMTGLDPNRMLNLLERVPSVAEDLATSVGSGDPMETVRSLSTLAEFSEDLPVPPAVRDQLATMDDALAGQLRAGFDILANLQDVCQPPLEPALEVVLAEICKPLEEVGNAEQLVDVIESITDVGAQVGRIEGIVASLNGFVRGNLTQLSVLINEIVNSARRVEPTVAAIANGIGDVAGRIDGVRGVVDSVNGFLRGAIAGTVGAIANGIGDIAGRIDGVRNVVNAIKDFLDVDLPDGPDFPDFPDIPNPF